MHFGVVTHMQFFVDDASSDADIKAVQYVENEVFRLEKRIDLPELQVPHGAAMLRVLARLGPGGDPVGTLTAVETTGDPHLNRDCGVMASESGIRVARYMRMAVLPPYRGYGLSIRMMLEVHQRFIVPNKIRHTWLLFDSRRVSSSLLLPVLGFRCGAHTIRSEYGPCRVLSRNELSSEAKQGTQRGWAFVARFQDLAA
jgi:hypothetical protein